MEGSQELRSEIVKNQLCDTQQNMAHIARGELPSDTSHNHLGSSGRVVKVGIAVDEDVTVHRVAESRRCSSRSH
jgi:hypothetical protein